MLFRSYRLTIALENHLSNENHPQNKDENVVVLSVTQLNDLNDVREEVHSVMNKRKPDSISHSIMQIRT